MFGDKGWYDYRPEPYRHGVLELYYWSMKEADRRRVPDSGWLAFLEGRNPGYPEAALRDDFTTIRRKVEAMRHDTTTPDTRLADDPMALQSGDRGDDGPADAGRARPQASGGSLARAGAILRPGQAAARSARRRRRSGRFAWGGSTSLVLVNLNQSEPRELIVQGGALRRASLRRGHEPNGPDDSGAWCHDSAFCWPPEPAAGSRSR